MQEFYSYSHPPRPAESTTLLPGSWAARGIKLMVLPLLCKRGVSLSHAIPVAHSLLYHALPSDYGVFANLLRARSARLVRQERKTTRV